MIIILNDYKIVIIDDLKKESLCFIRCYIRCLIIKKETQNHLVQYSHFPEEHIIARLIQ